MRWDALFADLEAQLSAAASGRADDADLVRAEVARTVLADRLRAQVGVGVQARLRDGSTAAGFVVEAAPAWLLVRDGSREVLLPVAALVWVSGLSGAVAAPAGQVERRLGLPGALRALARDRAPVQVRLDGATATGTIDRVGADHLDLAEHPLGEPRRAGAVRRVLTVPLPALLAVSSAGTAARGG